jgi:SpoVK/Ycf46/Vps4 family AAA+-type ATPase
MEKGESLVLVIIVRRIKHLFEYARQHSPAVIFFDEIEQLCNNSDGEGEVNRRLKTELLVQMQGNRSDVIYQI